MALRKLQAEIDKTLKTVAVGVETFEATFDKLGHASNATQKDKLENDLKTQIKKLQRMRDQIKAWLGSSDIKDKTALMDNRRLIETQMERFKALEKEMKMKAFSKEGLSAQSKLDPAEKAKREMIDWVGTMTEELSRQIEATEAELEGISTAKKKKGTGERVTELEEFNERRSWHIGRLEIVQRMLDNGQLQSEQVESIQEDVKYFIEANAEEDFEYDQGLYDDLNLLDEEDFGPGEFGLQQDEQSLDSASLVDPIDLSPIPTPAPKTPAKEEPAKKSTPASKSAKDSAVGPSTEDPPSPVLSKKAPSRKSTMDSSKVEQPKLARGDSIPPVPPLPASVVSPAAASTSTPTKAPLPPIRYAAAAAAAVAATAPMLSPSEVVTSPSKSKLDLPTESPALETHVPPATTTVPVSLSAKAEQLASAASLSTSTAAAPSTSAPPPPPGLSRSGVSTPNQPTSTLAPPSENPSVGAPPLLSPVAQTQPQTTVSTTPQSAPPPPPGYSLRAESSRTGASAGGFESPRLVPAGQSQPSQQQQTQSQQSQQQGVLGSLMQSFDSAKEMSERRGNDMSQLHQALEVSYRDAPLQADGEPPRYYLPKNPAKTPSHYPQTRATNLTDRSIYDRFDVDQLFFIFYYYSGSYEQCLAAEKLKQHNWRFHKQYLTWFKRAHNPQAITDEYEQGGYFYFDWENSWCQRKKSDFRFEYRWLSDN